MKKEMFVVMAAIIKEDGRYLIVQRPKNVHLAFKWEFPGGKVKFGETLSSCLTREIREELEIRIKVGKFFGLSSYVYDGKRQVILLGYSCKIIFGVIKEGINYAWVIPEEMDDYEFCEADTSFVKKLQNRD